MSVQDFNEDTSEQYYKWLHSLGNTDSLSKIELAELAYREASRVQFRRSFIIGKALAHPDLHVIAGALVSDPVTAA